MSTQPPPQATAPLGSDTVEEPHVLKQHHDIASISSHVRDALWIPSTQLRVLEVSAEDLGRITAGGLFCLGKGAQL